MFRKPYKMGKNRGYAMKRNDMQSKIKVLMVCHGRVNGLPNV